MKIFNKYLVKRSFVFSLFIFLLFALLDLVFNFISELENLSIDYTFLLALKHVFWSMPHRAIEFLEGACLLGVMISLGVSHQEGNLNVLRSSGQSPIKIVLISAIGPLVLVLSFLILDEAVFRGVHLDAKIDKNLYLQNSQKITASSQWIKHQDSLLSYTNVVDDNIFNVRFIKTKLNQASYFKTAGSAKISKEGVLFDDSMKAHNFNLNENDSNFEKFSFPLVAMIPFDDIDNLSLKKLNEYQDVMRQSSLEKDILFNSHLEKSYYKKIFFPISVLAIIIFFGSFIFGSLRDSTPGSKIVFAVLGGFIYKMIQDFSASIFISYSYPIVIGVIAPAVFLLIFSIFLYKRI